jgi:hypothetical protein
MTYLHRKLLTLACFFVSTFCQTFYSLMQFHSMSAFAHRWQYRLQCCKDSICDDAFTRWIIGWEVRQDCYREFLGVLLEQLCISVWLRTVVHMSYVRLIHTKPPQYFLYCVSLLSVRFDGISHRRHPQMDDSAHASSEVSISLSQNRFLGRMDTEREQIQAGILNNEQSWILHDGMHTCIRQIPIWSSITPYLTLVCALFLCEISVMPKSEKVSYNTGTVISLVRLRLSDS